MNLNKKKNKKSHYHWFDEVDEFPLNHHPDCVIYVDMLIQFGTFFPQQTEKVGFRCL